MVPHDALLHTSRTTVHLDYLVNPSLPCPQDEGSDAQS